MRPNSQARVSIGVALALLLGSCGEGPKDKSAFTDSQRDEITDIADDVLDDAIEGNAKILELEKKVGEKDQEIQELEGRINEIEQRLKI